MLIKKETKKTPWCLNMITSIFELRVSKLVEESLFDPCFKNRFKMLS